MLLVTASFILSTLYANERGANTGMISPDIIQAATILSSHTTSDPEEYKVARVIDGDTIVVSINGQESKIRLIGLDTPETVDPQKSVECFGKKASDKATELLNGQTVRIETDPSQELYDKYGRLLAYVFLPDGTNMNEKMISEGYGYEYTYDVPYRYQTDFKAAELSARTKKVGLWAPGACGH